MLYRKIQPYIEDYLKSDSNKVLIIDGARQIGKTYIIRHVGQQLFEKCGGALCYIGRSSLILKAT